MSNIEKLFSMQGKIALVTGAASGSVEAVFNATEKQVGTVNVLINAAAQLDLGLFPGISDEGWATCSTST